MRADFRKDLAEGTMFTDLQFGVNYSKRTKERNNDEGLVVADTATGEVKPLIQERMNVYIESKSLKVINNGTELVFWSERDGWGHYYLYGADGARFLAKVRDLLEEPVFLAL